MAVRQEGTSYEIFNFNHPGPDRRPLRGHALVAADSQRWADQLEHMAAKNIWEDLK